MLPLKRGGVLHSFNCTPTAFVVYASLRLHMRLADALVLLFVSIYC